MHFVDVYAEYGFCKNKLKVFADLRNISDSKYSETADLIHLVLMDMVE